MLIARALPRAVPGRIARTALLKPLPPSTASQWIRQKSTRPPYGSSQNAPAASKRAPLTPRDMEYNPNKATRPASESSRHERSSQETAEFNSEARPERNTASSSQPGPGRPGRTPTGRKDEADFDTAQEEFDSPQSPEANRTDADTQQSRPTRPLPDLRQGIPSTFAEEFLKKETPSQTAQSRTHAHHDINVTEDPRQNSGNAGDGPGREEGELPKSAYQTSIDKRREKMARYLYGAFGLFFSTGALYLGRNWDTEEEERSHLDAPSGWGWQLFYDRCKARISGQMGYYTEPTFPKLLPDVEPAPPYTLVLSLEDLMIHSEWSREHGWRTAKRPGIDYFLGYLSQYYELVLFTSLPVSAADQIVRKLDPFHFMTFPLFREATRYEKGHYVKDLSYLNRPLSKTLIIDTKSDHVSAQPENAIILKPWTGDPKDKELVNLIPFLEHIAAMGIADVRSALKSFEGKHIPTEFALREAKAREEFQKQLEEEKAKKPKRSGLGFFSGALGIKPQGGMTYDGQTSVAEELSKGKMLADQIRERGIKQYEALEKEIRENGEKWLKEEAELEKKMMAEQMKNMKRSVPFFGIGGGESKN